MKEYLTVGPWLAVMLGCLALPDSASANLRWRADGNVCRPWNEDTGFGTLDNMGFQIRASDGADAATCAIPLGPAMVDLGEGSGHELGQVNVRLLQQQEATTVATHLVVHDYDSTSMCMCGETSEFMPLDSFSLRLMPFDCGSCSYASSWGAAIHVNRTGAGITTIKLISVYDVN
jgi:hypothetical protein